MKKLLIIAIGLFSFLAMGQSGESFDVLLLNPRASAPTNAFWTDGSLYRGNDGVIYHKVSGSWVPLGAAAESLINVASGVLIGRTTAGSGNSEELNATQARALLNVEDGADVTDATNVNAAGAVMNSDTSTSGMGFVVDEDDMVSNSATKVPTQQSVKAYVDAAAGTYTDEQAQDAVGGILTDTGEIDFTYSDATPSISAALIAGSIDETKLDASTNASLDLADTATQPGDNISGLTNDAGYITSETDDQTALEVPYTPTGTYPTYSLGSNLDETDMDGVAKELHEEKIDDGSIAGGSLNLIARGTVRKTLSIKDGDIIEASGFNGKLANTDNTLQEVAQKVDDLIFGASLLPSNDLTNTDPTVNVANASMVEKLNSTGIIGDFIVEIPADATYDHADGTILYFQVDEEGAQITIQPESGVTGFSTYILTNGVVRFRKAGNNLWRLYNDVSGIDAADVIAAPFTGITGTTVQAQLEEIYGNFGTGLVVIPELDTGTNAASAHDYELVIDTDIPNISNGTNWYNLIKSDPTGRTNGEAITNVVSQPWADGVTDGAGPAGTLIVHPDAPPAKLFTGTEIPLTGYFQQDNTATDTATWTLGSDVRNGASAEILINQASEPAITGATQIPGTAAFETNTLSVITVKVILGTEYYYFTSLE